MVSKTVLACLAVLASISMVQGTVPLQGFSPCVQGAGFLNIGLGLGFDLGNLFGGILGVGVELINDVLATVQELLVGILSAGLNIVGGVLRGLFGGTMPPCPTNPSVIPYPNTVSKFILTQAQFATIYDKVFQLKFGNSWQAGALANVYLNIANLLSVQLGIGGSALGAIPDIATTRQQCSAIIANIGILQNDSNFQQVGVMLSAYLNLLGDDDQNINEQSFLDANSYLIKIQAAILQLGGYPSVPVYTNAFVQAYNGLNLGATIPGALDVALQLGGSGGIPHDCGCLKNTSRTKRQLSISKNK